MEVVAVGMVTFSQPQQEEQLQYAPHYIQRDITHELLKQYTCDGWYNKQMQPARIRHKHKHTYIHKNMIRIGRRAIAYVERIIVCRA